MPPLPQISGKSLLAILLRTGFMLVRVRGSHHFLRHEDGRVTCIPVHKNEDLPKGLLRKIIREDLQLDVESFIRLLK
jgi:predicted RNA binding protein YcfA (HicA-like mRNA interferase family)